MTALTEIAGALTGSTELTVFACAVFGLFIGSFVNVVALRLPRIMERDWKREARLVLDLPPEAREKDDGLSLSSPRSTCPHCGTSIKPWHNIPVLGWIFLKGQCAQCKAAISIQYPLVELVSGLVTGVCAWNLGASMGLLSALLVTWMLLPMIIIDLRTQLLPDSLTLPLLWAGLIFNLLGWGFVDLESAVLGAVFGYGSFWLIFQIFRLLTGKEGMGFGDFKLLAALGAWLGWQALPLIILLSSVVGALIGGALMVSGRLNRETPMPFGPYLAVAGWIAMLWGPQITAAYLGSFSGN